jgi:hypothetical protein
MGSKEGGLWRAGMKEAARSKSVMVDDAPPSHHGIVNFPLSRIFVCIGVAVEAEVTGAEVTGAEVTGAEVTGKRFNIGYLRHTCQA